MLARTANQFDDCIAVPQIETVSVGFDTHMLQSISDI
jgi:hypothetical protein